VTDALLLAVAYLLVALTVWETARGFFRVPTRFRIDILLVIGVLAVILLAGDAATRLAQSHPVLGVLIFGMFLGQPYLLLRLVNRFRHVPRALRWFAGSVALAGGVALMQLPAQSPAALVAVALYFVAMLTYSAVAQSPASRRFSSAPPD
jgi:hypothetical protein